MRVRLTLTAAALVLASPAIAADLYSPPSVPPMGDPVYSPAPLIVGHLMVGAGVVDTGNIADFDDLSDFNDTVGVFVGAGRGNIGLGGPWNLELETGGFSTFDGGSSYSSIGAAGHLWTKLSNGALGFYGGANWPSGGSVYTAGVEGEAYLGNITLGGDADYNWTDGSLGTGDYWSGSLWADAYLSQNWRVGGEFEYYGDSLDTWVASLDTEYRFGNSPISGWVEGSYADGGGSDTWAVLGGIRLFMDGGMTLIDHDRNVPWESGLLGPDQIRP
jgi:hypothetical protein